MRLFPYVRAFAALSGPSLAAEFNTATIAHWTVEKIFDSCVAYNRPNAEIEDAPVNLLAISRQEDGTTALVVSFWPAALGSDDMAMDIEIDGRPIRLTADGRRDYQSLRVSEVPADVLIQMRDAPGAPPTMKVIAYPSAASLVFDIGVIGEVLDAIDVCAAS